MKNFFLWVAVSLTCAGGLPHVRAAEPAMAPPAPPLLEGENTLLQTAPEEKKPEPPAAAKPKAATPDEPPADPSVIRVPYIPEQVKKELREEIKKDLRDEVTEDVIRRGRRERWAIPDSWPEWVRTMRWSGDIRLRAQRDDYADDNTVDFYRDIQKTNKDRTDTLLNTTEDRDRYRVRFRLGLEVKPDEAYDIGFRMATGNADDPVSTNQTMGSSFRPYSPYVDRAFLRYRNLSQSWTVWGGRMPNPWLSTDLVWDEDLAFDGFALKWRPGLEVSDNDYRAFDPFITLGIFPLQELELSKKDKWLQGAQTGFHWRMSQNNKLSTALSYYNFENIVGVANESGSDLNDPTAPQFVQKGNTMYLINNPSTPGRPLYGLASEYKEVNFTMSLANLSFAPTQVILTFDWVKNRGFDREEILARTGGSVYIGPLEEDTTGYQYKLTVGRPVVEREGEWQTFFAVKRLGRDAVLDAYTDSDFHLGGTDAKGWILGGSYGLAQNAWLSVRYLSSDAIKGPPLGIDTLQIDLNAKF
jgi:hypothetical protein